MLFDAIVDYVVLALSPIDRFFLGTDIVQLPTTFVSLFKSILHLFIYALNRPLVEYFKLYKALASFISIVDQFLHKSK